MANDVISFRKSIKSAVLCEVALDDDLMEVGRRAVEDALISFRNSRLLVMRNNGLVVKEADGTPSNVIRMGPEHGVKIALIAMAKYLESH